MHFVNFPGKFWPSQKYIAAIVLFTPVSFYPNASCTTLLQDAIFYSGNGVYRREPGWSCWNLFCKGLTLTMLVMFTLAMLLMLAALDTSSTSISSSSSTATVTIWSSSSYTKTSIQRISYLIGGAKMLHFIIHCTKLQKSAGDWAPKFTEMQLMPINFFYGVIF